jgi:uncharacterized protein YxjI
MDAAQANGAERYTIRRQVLKIFGAGFHIYDASGAVVGYCKQKAFRVREDLRIYTDDTCTEELLVISTRSVWDISGVYSVSLKSGDVIGAFRRHGVRSMVRDKWTVLGPDGQTIGEAHEDSAFKGLLRRSHDLFAAIIPQTFHITASDGREVATYRTHMNPFVHRISVTIHAEEDEHFDDLLLLAGGCLLIAIEGRQ